MTSLTNVVRILVITQVILLILIIAIPILKNGISAYLTM